MRKLSWLSLTVVAALLAGCGRTALVLNVDVRSLTGGFSANVPVLNNATIGPRRVDAQSQLIGFMGITSGSTAITLEVTPTGPTDLTLTIFIAPATTADGQVATAPYRVGATSPVPAAGGSVTRLALVAALGPAALEAVRSGSFKVAARIGSTPPVGGRIQLTELRLTLRRDPPPP